MLLRYASSLLLFLISIVLSAQTANDDSVQFKTYFYEGGAISSEGHLRDGRPDGYWKSYYRNGNLKAEGNRKNFMLDGPWIFYSEEGQKTVEINYKDDKKNGLRKTFLQDVVIKEENFVNDTIQGFVKEYFSAGDLKKEIPYINGVASGNGFEYDENGRIITLLTYKAGVLTKKQGINRLDEQMQKQGLWMAFYSNKQIQYEGPYINNLKNGYWKYYQQNGNLIRVEKWSMGELMENAQETAKIEIRRTLDPQTGKLAFKGSYRNGKPEGVHRQYDNEGNVTASKIYDNGIVMFEGIVDERGMKQGPWIEYYPTGEIKAEGSYKDNYKVGEWIYYYISGDIEQRGNYLRGMVDGTWKWFYENGQLWREEEYVMGMEDGLSTEYSDSGSVIATGEYIEGFKDGPWKLIVNDHREEGNYFEGEKTGTWKYYYLNNEQLHFEGEYENGLENGMHAYYYPNGGIRQRGNYEGGNKEGIWEYFSESGERIITIEYENGEEIRYNGEKINYGKKYERYLKKEEREREAAAKGS